MPVPRSDPNRTPASAYDHPARRAALSIRDVRPHARDASSVRDDRAHTGPRSACATTRRMPDGGLWLRRSRARRTALSVCGDPVHTGPSPASTPIRHTPNAVSVDNNPAYAERSQCRHRSGARRAQSASTPIRCTSSAVGVDTDSVHAGTWSVTTTIRRRPGRSRWLPASGICRDVVEGYDDPVSRDSRAVRNRPVREPPRSGGRGRSGLEDSMHATTLNRTPRRHHSQPP